MNIIRSRALALAVAFCSAVGLVQAQSSQNPVATYYADQGYPVWMDGVAWSNRINMATYANGANDFEKFENARDLLAGQGGGVLFYPAGSYDFSAHPTGPNGRGLMLKTGVVIVGEAPAAGQGKAVIDSVTSGLSNLQTVFNFGFSQKVTATGGVGEVPDNWSMIGLYADANTRISQATSVGIAWVKLNGGYVFFGPDAAFLPTLGAGRGPAFQKARVTVNAGQTQAWSERVPNGQLPIDIFGGAPNPVASFHTEGRRFVFGCRLENSCVHNDFTVNYKRQSGLDSSDADFYAPYRFSARITCEGPNAFVANNALPKSDKNFLYTQKTINTARTGTNISTILYDYGKTGGIDINKQLINTLSDKCDYRNGPIVSQNVVIRDNWVYNHGHKGIEGMGKYLVIRDNVNQRDYLNVSNAAYGIATPQSALTLDGWIEAKPTDDNLSRAYDIGGWNLWVHKNYWDNAGSDPGNDGEGILIQPQGGLIVAGWAVTNNSQGNRGEDGYIAPYDVPVYGMLQYGNYLKGDRGTGVFDPSSDEFVEDMAVVENYRLDRVTPVGVSGTNGRNVRDFLTVCPASSPIPPTNVTATLLPGQGIQVRWEDASTTEIGFRVERRQENFQDWVVIAIRPRNETGSNVVNFSARDNGTIPAGCANQGNFDFNEQEWFDYLGNPGVNYEYRVVAFNCENDDQGATTPSPAVTFPTSTAKTISQNLRLTVFPNPASSVTTVSIPGAKGISSLQVFDATGRVVAKANMANEARLPVAHLPQGVYRVVVRTAQGQVLTSSLVR